MAQYDRLPWFKFFVVDWLTDPLVCSLNLAQQGLFLRLLCIQWREGFLHWDLDVIRRTAGVGVQQWNHGGDDTEVMMSSGLKVIAFPPIHEFIDQAFPICQDGNRRNPKLERIREELLRIQDAQSKGGRKKESSKSLPSEQQETGKYIDDLDDRDRDPDSPPENQRGNPDAANAAIGSRYVRGEGDVVWFNPDNTLGWCDTAVDELQKRFPARTRQLSRLGEDWLSELSSLSNWHATAPKSKQKRISAHRWLLGRLFSRLEKSAVHAEKHQPRGRVPAKSNGLEHADSSPVPEPPDPEIARRNQERERERLARQKAEREAKATPITAEERYAEQRRKWRESRT